MPNPTRAQILNAHDAVEGLTNVALPTADFCGDTSKFLMWKNDILAALPPKPALTMNEIEWDDDEHFLAEAEHPDWGKVVMLRESALIIFVQPIEKRMGDIHVARVEELTPTGRRYTLTEVQE